MQLNGGWVGLGGRRSKGPKGPNNCKISKLNFPRAYLGGVAEALAVKAY